MPVTSWALRPWARDPTESSERTKGREEGFCMTEERDGLVFQDRRALRTVFREALAVFILSFGESSPGERACDHKLSLHPRCSKHL